ncbi:MAG: hypothetical protein O9327_18650, partial [Polaromonas sp.]|nr:hypothetical protein [Polaromonas sp.]
AGAAQVHPAAALQPGAACNIWHQLVNLSAPEYELLLQLQQGRQAPTTADSANLLERLRRFGLLV